MTARQQRDEIALDPPRVRHRDVVPAVEDRSYVVFIAGALVSGLAAGFVLGIVAALSGAGVVLDDRLPWLIQAHGWSQLQGWTGLFVAGMGFRLLPRFAGRRPLPRTANFAVFALLFSGTALRTVTQPFAGDAPSEAGLLAGELLWAAGAAAFAFIVLYTLLRGRPVREPWRAFAFAGAVWWLAWAAASIEAGRKAYDTSAFVTPILDDPMTWAVMLGAIGNFVWSVQSRSVPIFFGRKTPSLRAVAIPGILLNAGAATIFAAGWREELAPHSRLMGAGFLLAAVALVWLAPFAGSCWGSPKRLRPRARAAARFVLVANIAAVVCGVLLAWAGFELLTEGSLVAGGVRDAARHTFGIGVITFLIVGMAQLVAPFFALRRVESRGALVDSAVLFLLVAAVVLRILSGLLTGHMDHDARMHLSAAAGVAAWLALALFAGTVLHAIRNEPRIKASLADNARAKS